MQNPDRPEDAPEDTYDDLVDEDLLNEYDEEEEEEDYIDEELDECLSKIENLFKALNFEEFKHCTCRSRSVSPGHVAPAGAPKRKRSLSEPIQDKKSRI